MKLAETQALFWEAVRARRAPAALREVFVSRGELDADARMQIYRAAYWSRHEKVLQDSFPALLERVGAPTFRKLVAGYIERHPSTEVAIERAGQGFPAFVSSAAALGEPCAALGELAELEWARVLAVLAEDPPRAFDPRALAAAGATQHPLGMLPSLSLVVVDSQAIAVWRGQRGALEAQLLDDEARALTRALRSESLSAACAEFSGDAATARAERVLTGWIGRGWIVELKSWECFSS